MLKKGFFFSLPLKPSHRGRDNITFLLLITSKHRLLLSKTYKFYLFWGLGMNVFMLLKIYDKRIE